jgi:hypothetical protein
VCELFFILAVNHVGADQGIDLGHPFSTNLKKLRAPDGKLMSNRDAVANLADYRDALKPRGALPGPEQLEIARHDAARFLTTNCPRFFGMKFTEISLFHVVPQTGVAMVAIGGGGPIADIMDQWRARQRWAETGGTRTPSDLDDAAKLRLIPRFAAAVKAMVASGQVELWDGFPEYASSTLVLDAEIDDVLADPDGSLTGPDGYRRMIVVQAV